MCVPESKGGKTFLLSGKTSSIDVDSWAGTIVFTGGKRPHGARVTITTATKLLATLTGWMLCQKILTLLARELVSKAIQCVKKNARKGDGAA